MKTLWFYFICVATLIFTYSHTYSQDLRSHIPASATLVVSMNNAQLSAADHDWLEELDFFQEMVREIGPRTESLRNKATIKPADYGVDMRKNAYFFIGNEGGSQYYGFLMHLADRDQFARIAKESKYEGDEIRTDGNLEMLLKGRNGIAWTEDYLLMMEVDQNFNGPNSYDLDWEQRQEARKEATASQILKIANMQSMNSVLTNTHFISDKKTGGMMQVWINTYGSMQAYEEMLQPLGSTSAIEALRKLYRGNYTHVDMSFDTGKITIGTQSTANQEIRDLVKSVNKARINRKFFKYVPEENLLGYYGFAFNTQNLWEGLKDLTYPIIDSIPATMQLFSTSSDVLDILIDEDAIYDLIPGNAMVAVTGIRPFETSYVTYEYDEDFNSTEVVKTREEYLPEFSFMLSTESEGDMRKIAKLMERAPTGIAARRGHYWHFPQVAKASGFEMFMAIHDGIVFVTNNEPLVRDYLISGYPAEQQLSKKHQKMLRKNNLAAFWNTQHTLNSLPQEAWKMDSLSQEMLGLAASELGSMTYRGASRKNPMNGYLEYTFQDKESDSFRKAFGLINQLYVMEESRSSYNPYDVEVAPDYGNEAPIQYEPNMPPPGPPVMEMEPEPVEDAMEVPDVEEDNDK